MSPPIDRRALDLEWRAEVDRQLAEHSDSLREGDARMTRIESSIDRFDESATKLSTVSDGLSEALVWFRKFAGFRDVVRLLADALVRVSIVLIAAGIVWWFVKTGELPHKSESSALSSPVVVHHEPPQEVSNGREP